VPESTSGQAGPTLTTAAEIAAEVLARTPGDLQAQARHESFVGMGGSSMDAVRLLSLCERRLGMTIDLARLLSQAPLAEVLAEVTGCEEPPGAEERAAGRLARDRELLPGQREMLLAEKYGGAGSALRQLGSAELSGPLDVAALKQTLSWIVARHEALRTVFVQTGKIDFARRVLPACEPRLISQRLRVAPGDNGVDAVHERVGDIAEQMLPPLGLPPVVFVLTELGERHHLLSVLIHHLIADAWAAGLLWREIFEHYRALAAGAEPPVMPPAPSPDLIARRRAALDASGRLAELTEARIAQLKGVPAVIDLPTVLPRAPGIDFRAGRLPFTLTRAARDACDDLAGRAKVTRTMVMLAAWALVVARRAGMSECVIGGVALQRPTAELMRTVASCAAPVPIRCAFPDDQPAGDYLRAIAGASGDAVAAADVPLDSLIAGLGVAAADRRLPLVQVMFSAYDGYIPLTMQAGDLHVRFHESYCGGTSVDVALFLQGWDDAPGLIMEYAVSVLTAGEAARLAGSLNDTLCELAHRLDSPLSQVSVT